MDKLILVLLLLALLSVACCDRLFNPQGDQPRPAPECRLPRARGPCKRRLTRYFYNTRNGRCERFIYGGCRGNRNNFASTGECFEKCKPFRGEVAFG
uniref:Putative bpti/kunitz family of serine protease inhibitor n=1 Tax=Amblyomma triste TaxID=251400 RepID=A0A023G828_AMBTT